MIRRRGPGGARGGRHVGLQQLSAFADAGRTLLGPAKPPKFVADEGSRESVLVSSAARLLDALDLRGAAGQLLREALLAHRDACGTGLSTLLFLVGAWSSAAHECLRLGVPVPVIAAVMAEGLSACEEEAVALQAPLQPSSGPALEPGGVSLRPGPPAAPHARWLRGEAASTRGAQVGPAAPAEAPGDSAGDLGGGLPAAPGARRPALLHSRHFRGAGAGVGAGAGAGQAAAASVPCSAAVALGLSHGDQGSMQLAVAAAQLQGCGALDLSRVATCCFAGPPEAAACVSPGYVAVLPAASAGLARDLQARPMRVVLVEGDLTERYRHPGFSRPANARAVLGGPGTRPDGAEQPWADRVLAALARFRVDLVLVQGGVSEPLADRCAHGRRLVLGSVGSRVLRAFAEASGARPLAYLTQLDGDCVGSGVRLAPWHGAGAAGAAVVLQAEGLRLVTAVLTSPAAAQLPGREDRFWTCACRLHHALRERRVLPGAGAVELLCLCRLQRLAERPASRGGPDHGGALPAGSWLGPALRCYRPAVLDGLALGWRRYLCALLCNSAHCRSEPEAGALVQRHLREAERHGSPRAYVLEQHGALSRVGGGPDGPRAPPRVYDAVTPKLEAWRRALDVVLLVLRTDSEVVTGPGRARDPPEGWLRL